MEGLVDQPQALLGMHTPLAKVSAAGTADGEHAVVRTIAYQHPRSADADETIVTAGGAQTLLLGSQNNAHSWSSSSLTGARDCITIDDLI